MKKRSFIVLLAVMMALVTVLAACGSSNNGDKNNKNPQGNNQGNNQGSVEERSEVSVWYLWGGREGQAIEDVIENFNNSQDKYLAVGLSVPDEQKIKVAIASNEGPDLTDSFSRNISAYAEAGISIPLDDLIARDNYDLSDYVEAAMETVTYNGEIHALPLNVTNDALYYNKRLLEAAGYTEPPKTSQELLDMSIAMTTVNDNGTIQTLGFPMYPNVPYRQLLYSFGGSELSPDGKEVQFESAASLEALRIIHEYTEQFGAENIKEIQASGKWLDSNDPFLRGEQVFRIEGSAMTAFIDDNNLDIDYGVVPLPYLEGHPETEGSTEIKSSTFYITKTAKNVDGAWEFLKFMYEAPELAKVMSTMSNIPSRMSAWEDPLFKDKGDVRKFMDYSLHDNAKIIPNIPQLDEILNKVIREEIEALSNLRQTAEQTAEKMQQRTLSILK